MKQYIIELHTKVNGKFQKGYHQKISESKRTDTMNVYVEHITKDKSKAKRFSDQEEAERIGKLFSVLTVQVAIVKTVRK